MDDNQPQARETQKIGQWMIYAMWIVVLLGLTYFFSGVLDKQRNPNAHVAGRVSAEGNPEVVLQRNRYGHYVANGKINGHDVIFLLDTGATDVSIPEQVAQRVGLRRGAGHSAMTANGTVQVFATQLEQVELGSIKLKKVRASINPHMGGEEILLGMSFLRQLDFSQTGKQLTLKQRAL
ncbi:TIGR02281 family clan AA aspartic protease [Gammaproteobacteria bacterium AH-315-C21]|nr:TIGR02281 family clan AA aspartic protease [Gammaproteobacteria bacterium]MBN4078983.1 TIGR02281 family clan AA aspartic protease [Gammaproteobacteria bacterium AH-315-C21]PCH63707.1 MAG: TIGR02281 family clan AA aspartic protease [Gammaproteobacteria bacterium]